MTQCEKPTQEIRNTIKKSENTSLLPKHILLMALIYKNWLGQRSYTQHFTREVAKMLNNNKHGEDGISHFLSITVLNKKLKILYKLLTDRLQAGLDSLIDISNMGFSRKFSYLSHKIIL